MIRKIASVSLCLLLAVTLVSCLEEEEKKSNTGAAERAAIENSMIDIPSSLSSASGASSSVVLNLKASTDQDQIVEEVYNGVRGTIAGVENLATVAKTVVLWSTVLFAAADSGDWTNDDPEADEADRIVWGPLDGAAYEKSIELYYGDQVGLKVLLTANIEASNAKGIMLWDGSVVPDNDASNDSTKVKIVFDGTVAPRTMDVYVMDINVTDSTAYRNAIVKVQADENGYVQLSGCYYIPGAVIFEDAAPQERCYTFTAVGYEEDAADAALANHGVLRLAIPEATMSDSLASAMFADYSVGQVFLDEIARRLKADWTTGGVTVGDLNSALGTTLEGTTIAALTDADIIDILKWAAANAADTDNTTAQSLQNMLFVLNLVNPAYFDSTGFVGTYGLIDGETRGTLDAAPVGFGTLDPATVLAILPLSVKNLDFSADF